ncbi:hypothetical protein BY996DRAFT_4572917 [Phakopsora pachyrhizi]|nr:hypothetical protein BY996DRAFT_4572917 [Phakopsora pachyrhizi]
MTSLRPEGLLKEDNSVVEKNQDERNVSDDYKSLNETEEEEEEEEEEGDDDDPIVKRIPLFFNSNPDFTLPSFAHFQPSLQDDEQQDNQKSDYKPKLPRKKPLTLLQYPFKLSDSKTQHVLLPPSLRPDNRTNSKTTSQIQPAQITARYKTGVRQLSLEVPLEIRLGTSENRFSDDRARNFGRANGIDSSNRTGTGTVNSSKGFGMTGIDDMDHEPIDRITLSSNIVPEQTNYLVGIIRPGNSKTNEDDDEDEAEEVSEEIHLVPLDQTLQLRPDLDYLDRLDLINLQAEKQSRTNEANSDDSGDESTDNNNNNNNNNNDDSSKRKSSASKKKLEANEARSIQVSVNNNPEADRGGMGLKGSSGGLFATIRAAEAESFVHLTHYHSQTKESESIKQKMYVDQRKRLGCKTSWSEVLKV